MGKMTFFGQHAFEDLGITAAETCGISCLLMTLDYFGIEFPTKEKEKTYYRRYKSKVLGKGTLGSRIAYLLAEKKLDVTLAHSSEKYLENSGGYYPEELFEKILAEHKKHIEQAKGSFAVEAGKNITCDTVADEIEKDRILILQTFVEGNADGIHDKVMHWIVVYGFEKGIFHVCDPGSGKKEFTKEELEGYMETPFGRTYISVGKK